MNWASAIAPYGCGKCESVTLTTLTHVTYFRMAAELAVSPREALRKAGPSQRIEDVLRGCRGLGGSIKWEETRSSSGQLHMSFFDI